MDKMDKMDKIFVNFDEFDDLEAFLTKDILIKILYSKLKPEEDLELHNHKYFSYITPDSVPSESDLIKYIEDIETYLKDYILSEGFLLYKELEEIFYKLGNKDIILEGNQIPLFLYFMITTTDLDFKEFMAYFLKDNDGLKIRIKGENLEYINVSIDKFFIQHTQLTYDIYFSLVQMPLTMENYSNTIIYGYKDGIVFFKDDKQIFAT